jgi:hypothetical protein
VISNIYDSDFPRDKNVEGTVVEEMDISNDTHISSQRKNQNMLREKEEPKKIPKAMSNS